MPRRAISLQPRIGFAGRLGPGVPGIRPGYDPLYRAKDQTLKTVAKPHLYIDAEDPTFSHAQRVGHSIIHGYRYFWGGGGGITVAKSAAYNNRHIYDGVGQAHNFRVFPDPANKAGFTLIICASVPQSVLDAIDGATLNSRYLLTMWDPIAANRRQSIALTGTATVKGWSFDAMVGTGFNFNLLFSALPAMRPTADVPFLLAWKIDAITRGSWVYFNDGTTALDNRVLTQIDTQAISYYTPMSLGPNNVGGSWEGDMASLFVSDDGAPGDAMTDAQRTGIMNDWRAWYGIP